MMKPEVRRPRIASSVLGGLDCTLLWGLLQVSRVQRTDKSTKLTGSRHTSERARESEVARNGKRKQADQRMRRGKWSSDKEGGKNRAKQRQRQKV